MKSSPNFGKIVLISLDFKTSSLIAFIPLIPLNNFALELEAIPFPNSLREGITESIIFFFSSISDINLSGFEASKNVFLFRGIKGIKAINEEDLMKEFYVGNFSIKRIERKIPIKILRGEIKTEFQKSIDTDKKAFREVKFLKDLSEIKTQYIVYESSLAIISFHEEPFGVIIEDEFVHHSINLVFYFLFKMTKG